MKKLFILAAVFLSLPTEGHAVPLSAYFTSKKGYLPEFDASFTLPNGAKIWRAVVVNKRIGISDDITIKGNEIKIPFVIMSPYGGMVQNGVCQVPIKTGEDIESIGLYFEWKGANNKNDPPWFSDCDVKKRLKPQNLKPLHSEDDNQ